MERVLHLQKLILQSQRLPWIVILVTLAILAGVIALTMEQTRGRIRAQISGRDAEVLNAVAQMQMPASDSAELVGSVEDSANQLTVILQTSRLGGVLGARLFDTNGTFVGSFPEDLQEVPVAGSELAILRQLRPTTRFRDDAKLSEMFLALETETEPKVALLEVNVPLHLPAEKRLVGIAQFIIEGHSIAEEFRRLDRNLWTQALMAFVPAALLLSAAILWAFRRLSHAHRLLAERTQTLLRANQELTLAAKTSAVGAVTSHLIHGLKNPLAGLQTFVASLGAAVADRPDTDLQHAIATTRRMQAMINEVVSVLREEEGAGHYEIPIAELVEMIAGKVRPLCRERNIEFNTALHAPAVLPNRAANLVALILANLVQNAIEATPSGGVVQLRLDFEQGRLVCSIQDQGDGFPTDRSAFSPCQSTKEGGSGIGLAISKQLATHLGAELELRHSSSAGSLFALSIPAGVWKEKSRSVTVTLS